ncbi:helix-turn-helix domain-containing protein [Cellvibrio mixtus]|uniref:helix-turn-helix domain-containing protein n=1 Tax=Cellvibrio mixtus TaxID=39650 RepID=UPI003CC82E78
MVPLDLRGELLRLGLNQAQVAEKTGVSRKMWGRYERGGGIPGGEVLFSFALIGADIQFVMTGMRSDSSIALTPREVALVNNFKNMLDEDKCAIERLASSVSKI